MTDVETPGRSRRARTAGLTLFGVAGVALVLGVVTTFSGGSSPRTTAAGGPVATPSPTVRPPATTEPAPRTTQVIPPLPLPGTGAATAVPPAPTSVAATPGAPAGIAAVPVRVFNNSTIKGLAARAADDLRAAGWNVVEVGNYSSGVIPTTTVYFRPGTDEQDAASQLAASFPVHVEPRFPGIDSTPDGLVFIVTNDYHGPSASAAK